MKNEFKASRVLCLLGAVVVLFLSVSCGGGGGGGEEETNNGDGEPLGTYDFTLSFLDDYPIELTSNEGTTIELEGLVPDSHIAGTYDLDNDAITLDSGPMVKATTNLWGGLSGMEVRINLDTDIVSVDGGHPTAGAVSLDVTDPEEPEAAYMVTFTISSPGGATVVDLENHDTAQTAQYTWDEFEELLWSETADDWERQASFVNYVLTYYFYELKFVVRTLMLIEENDVELETQSVTVAGDAFPGTPPAGTARQGSLVLDCTFGDAGPSSNFSEVFEDFWSDEPGNELDSLYNGTVNFVGFVENSDEARDVITSIGFLPNGPEEPGGVFYDGEGLTIAETEGTSGTFAINGWYTITGRYDILFYEHENE